MGGREGVLNERSRGAESLCDLGEPKTEKVWCSCTLCALFRHGCSWLAIHIVRFCRVQWAQIGFQPRAMLVIAVFHNGRLGFALSRCK